jgi:hypothetical protein
MIAIRNLYWTEGIAAFIVGELIWLARCIRSAARRRGVPAPQGPRRFAEGSGEWLRLAHIGATFTNIQHCARLTNRSIRR